MLSDVSNSPPLAIATQKMAAVKDTLSDLQSSFSASIMVENIRPTFWSCYREILT